MKERGGDSLSLRPLVGGKGGFPLTRAEDLSDGSDGSAGKLLSKNKNNGIRNEMGQDAVPKAV